MRRTLGHEEASTGTNALCRWRITLYAAHVQYALALDPNLDVRQYAQTSWKIRDGFAKGQIHSIAQALDGYLWLGTEFGLLRFERCPYSSVATKGR